MFTKKTKLTGFLLAAGSFVYAQQITPSVVNNCGTSFTTPSASITYSIGETAITKIGNGSNNITQGFLQPLVNGNSIKENKASYNFAMYPNPSSQEVKIESANYKEEVFVKLLDATGKLLYSGNLSNGSLFIGNYPNGLYQLLVLDKDQQLLERKTINKIN